MNSIPRVAPLRRLVREVLMTTENNSAAPPPEESSPAPGAAVMYSALPATDEQRRIWQSTDLLGADAEALIVHRGQTYRLRCTKQGKLILYK